MGPHGCAGGRVSGGWARTAGWGGSGEGSATTITPRARPPRLRLGASSPRRTLRQHGRCVEAAGGSVGCAPGGFEGAAVLSEGRDQVVPTTGPLALREGFEGHRAPRLGAGAIGGAGEGFGVRSGLDCVGLGVPHPQVDVELEVGCDLEPAGWMLRIGELGYVENRRFRVDAPQGRVRACLEAAIGAPIAGATFSGRVGADRFRLVRNDLSPRNIRPTAVGTFRPVDGGTVVELRCAAPWWVPRGCGACLSWPARSVR